jgi:hypothetical protein
MKKLVLALCLVVTIAALSAGTLFALDPVASHATAIETASPAPVAAAPAATTAPAAAVLPSLPTLPASHDTGSIILYVVALVGWLAAMGSELMALIPGFKGNGWLHSIVEGCKALSSNAETKTVTLDIGQLQQLIHGTPPAAEVTDKAS